MWLEYVIKIIKSYFADTYKESELEDIIIAAAFHVKNELSLDYTIDIFSSLISPDPSQDYPFIYLTGLKSVCILAKAELRAASLGSIKITDGPSSIDTSVRTKAIKDLLDSCVEEYERAKLNIGLGDLAFRTAVLGPTTQDTNNYGGFR